MLWGQGRVYYVPNWAIHGTAEYKNTLKTHEHGQTLKTHEQEQDKDIVTRSRQYK